MSMSARILKALAATKTAERFGAAAGVVLFVLVLLDLPDRFGVSAEDTLLLVTAALPLASFVRGAYQAWRGHTALPPAPEIDPVVLEQVRNVIDAAIAKHANATTRRTPVDEPELKG